MKKKGWGKVLKTKPPKKDAVKKAPDKLKTPPPAPGKPAAAAASSPPNDVTKKGLESRAARGVARNDKKGVDLPPAKTDDQKGKPKQQELGGMPEKDALQKEGEELATLIDSVKNREKDVQDKENEVIPRMREEGRSILVVRAPDSGNEHTFTLEKGKEKFTKKRSEVVA